MQLEQTLRTLCALPAVSGFEMQAAKAVAELFRPYCDTVDADKNGNVIGSLSCGKEGAKTVLLDAAFSAAYGRSVHVNLKQEGMEKAAAKAAAASPAKKIIEQSYDIFGRENIELTD